MSTDEIEIRVKMLASSVLLLEAGVDVKRHWLRANEDGTYTLCATMRVEEIDNEGLWPLVLRHEASA